MKVKQLFDFGFKTPEHGQYSISKILTRDDSTDLQSCITYRPGKGILVDPESEVDFSKFSVKTYSSTPIKVDSIHNLMLFANFFKY